MFRKVLSLVVIGLAIATNTQVFADGPRDTTITKVVEKNMPSVVSIAKRDVGTFQVDGSGVIVDSRGYVLTCNHVVTDMAQISVGFNDGAFLDADVVWNDLHTDLALLQVKGKHAFPEARLGPADLKLGEPLIVIGCPKRLQHVVTQGIVSKIGDVRWDHLFDGRTFKKAIQSDAAINGGNSGGPAFNADGEVVGVVFVSKNDAEGISWAINIDIAMHKLSSASSARAMAGVEHGISVEHQLTAGKPGPERRKVLVWRTSGPAAHAGLQRGDRILMVMVKEGNKKVERPIYSRFDLERAFWSCKPDDKATLTVTRNGKLLTIELTLGGSGIEPDEL